MAIGAYMAATSKDDLIIAGFDVQAALVRTMGNREFYLQLLTRFRDDQHDAAERIAKALEGEQPMLAERLAHTLKGVAALVGADRMSELAGELESAIQTGANGPALSGMLGRVVADMQLLMRALDAVLPQPVQPGMGKS
jgi:two-component system, sensor histidine kinase and response regulator